MFLIGGSLNAQVESIDYQLQYDTVNCRYDAMLIINQGAASSVSDRIQFNAQYSIVVPTGTDVEVVENHNPLVGNQNYDSTTPCQWILTSTDDAPPVSPDQKFISFVPALSPQSLYNNVSAGDTVKLFSFTASPVTNCGLEIRMWENEVDPSSAVLPSGADFTNGFTMGSAAQVYEDNATQQYPPKPTIVDIVNSCGEGLEIDLSAFTSDCQGPLTFEWEGPGGYTATTEDINRTPADPSMEGWYVVTITDGFGCITVDSVDARSKPYAGPDTVMCAGGFIDLVGSDPPAGVSGTWSQSDQNSAAFLITLDAVDDKTVRVNANINASGSYDLVYSLPGCSDTTTVTINPAPRIILQDDGFVCSFDSVRFIANIPGGTWSTNDGSVATIDPVTGWATGVDGGSTTVTYTLDATGCFAESQILTVTPPPVVTNDLDTICIGSFTDVTPTAGGTWATSDGSVATVTDGGIVEGIGEGVAELRFTDSNTGCTSDTVFITVIPQPTITFVGNDSICVNGVTQLEPSDNVSWTSSNTSIATITTDGIVTGIAPGTVTVQVTDLVTGCVSDVTPTIYVLDAPTVALDATASICIGDLTSVNSFGVAGTWVAVDDAVASVDANTGLVTAEGPGQTTFIFTATATGCTAETGPLVVDSPPPATAQFPTICINNQTDLNPASGGTWTAYDEDIASLSPNGFIAIGQSAGTARFIFTSDDTGCDSDTVFVTVTPGDDISITGPTNICVGEMTTLEADNGATGTWSSSNNAVATITGAGVVSGVSPGAVVFTFTNGTTLCQSLESPPIFVDPTPVVLLPNTDLCLEDVMTASSTLNTGSWSSSDNAVATINPFTGEITPVMPGPVTFTYTTFGGCSATTPNLTINQSPDAVFDGPNEVCVDDNITVSSTATGTWVSVDQSIATIGNTSGLVTGVSAGTTQLVFSETATGCLSDTLTVTVIAAADVGFDGPDELCIGEMTTLSSDGVVGTWSVVGGGSDIATVTPDGIVTAEGPGAVTFQFTTGTGNCSSANTPPLLVNAPPTIILPETSACVGEMVTADSPTPGMWVSTDTSVAVIDTFSGVITAITPGTTTFFFTDTASGCESEESVIFTVATPEPVFGGGVQICVGETTNVFPSVGGTWSSSADSVAIVNSIGQVTAQGPGTAVFYFTAFDGCTSAPTDTVTVTPGPDTNIGPDNELCIGDEIIITPNTGGTWVSSAPEVATITDAGVVTAEGAGVATFTFTSDVTGCSSQPTDPVTVNAPVSIFNTGGDIICIDGTTTMTPNGSGVWISNDESVATIDPTSGVVTGVGVGGTTFQYTPDDTGCITPPSDSVFVSPAPDVGIDGLSEICIGATTTLFPSDGGQWASSDESVATVSDDGIVTAIGSGIVTFTFTDQVSGCSSSAATEPITITDCINPDFNATFVDVVAAGNVETNDDTPAGTTYGPSPVYTGGPAGAVFTLDILPNGEYTFVSNTVGVYTWNVQVCIPPLVSGCQTSELTITVVDHLQPDLRPVANVDIATTGPNVPVEINTLANDQCVVVGECSLDASSVTIISNPSNGSVTVDGATGNTTYTPALDFVGLDTLRYQVCVDGEPLNCAQAFQVITILGPTALNTTTAADDFATGPQDTPLTGDASLNDLDFEGDNQTVKANTITNDAGTFTIAPDGTWTFTPSETFFGQVDFPYTTCDDNVEQKCADATVHILIVRDIYVQVRVYLEGTFINNGDEVGTTHSRPLMRDDLRSSPFNGVRYIPNVEPYDSMVIKGLVKEYWETFDNPSTLFAVEGEDALVDWVRIELRDKNDYTSIVATRSGLVQRDGDVIDLNGEMGLRFKGLDVDDYYIVVNHRNHLGAMTEAAQTPEQYTDLVDFTVTETGFFTYGTSKFAQYDYTGLAQAELSGRPSSNLTGYRALWAGDSDGNGRIKFTQPEDDLNVIFGNVFGYVSPDGSYNFYTNFDFAFGYQQGDYDLNSKAKFDNPNDDKNYLFGQLLFYPLNAEFRSNFDFFIEQIPYEVLLR